MPGPFRLATPAARSRMQPVARQVEEIAVALAIGEEPKRLGILGLEGLKKLRPDLVGALADRGADDGVIPRARRPAPPSRRPSPPARRQACRASRHGPRPPPRLRIGEQHRLAIGGQHRKRSPAWRSPARRPRGGSSKRAGGPDHIGRMHLVHGDQRLRRTSSASADAGAVDAHASAWSDEPGPQFSPSNTPDDAPPLRVKKPWGRGQADRAVMISSVMVQSGRRGGAFGVKRDHLEEVPISSGCVKRRCAAICASSAAPSSPGQRLRARGDAEPFEEHALRGQRLGASRVRRGPAPRNPHARSGRPRPGGQRIDSAHGRAPPAACRPATASRRSRRSAPRRHGAAIRSPISARIRRARRADLDEGRPRRVSSSRCASAAPARARQPEAPARRPSAHHAARAQPAARWNWRIGSASKNSLATTKSGRRAGCGVSCQ
jgi:hypothetical protein